MSQLIELRFAWIPEVISCEWHRSGLSDSCSAHKDLFCCLYSVMCELLTDWYSSQVCFSFSGCYLPCVCLFIPASINLVSQLAGKTQRERDGNTETEKVTQRCERKKREGVNENERDQEGRATHRQRQRRSESERKGEGGGDKEKRLSSTGFLWG